MTRLTSSIVSQIKAFQLQNPDESKSFVVSLDDIATLFSQGQPQGKGALKGYMAIDADGKLTCFFLACVEDGRGGFDDYGIPGGNLQSSTVIVIQGRPCPLECGKENILNK